VPRFIARTIRAVRITSRVSERPVSVALKGPSASGKSFTEETVLKFFPGMAFHEMTGMSERALVYSEVPLEHRMLVTAFASSAKPSNPGFTSISGRSGATVVMSRRLAQNARSRTFV
jgi:hypothetical protein